MAQMIKSLVLVSMALYDALSRAWYKLFSFNNLEQLQFPGFCGSEYDNDNGNGVASLL